MDVAKKRKFQQNSMIIPFCTHWGSGFSNTISTIALLQPNATITTNGLSISKIDVTDAKTAMKS